MNPVNQASAAASAMPTDLSPTEYWLTLGGLIFGFGLAGLMAILERRPRKDLNPRLIPTTPVMFAGVLIGLLALVHLLNLSGIHTGR